MARRCENACACKNRISSKTTNEIATQKKSDAEAYKSRRKRPGDTLSTNSSIFSSVLAVVVRFRRLCYTSTLYAHSILCVLLLTSFSRQIAYASKIRAAWGSMNKNKTEKKYISKRKKSPRVVADCGRTNKKGRWKTRELDDKTRWMENLWCCFAHTRRIITTYNTTDGENWAHKDDGGDSASATGERRRRKKNQRKSRHKFMYFLICVEMRWKSNYFIKSVFMVPICLFLSHLVTAVSFTYIFHICVDGFRRNCFGFGFGFVFVSSAAGRNGMTINGCLGEIVLTHTRCKRLGKRQRIPFTLLSASAKEDTGRWRRRCGYQRNGIGRISLKMV